MHSIIKSTFYIVFISISLIAGMNMLFSSKGDKKVKLFGLMVLTLGIGESFHLVPRIFEIFSNDSNSFELLIENGRFIASITITFFYILSFWFYKLYYKSSTSKKTEYVLLILSVISIIVSILLKDSMETFNIIIRNTPMVFIGIVIISKFKRGSGQQSNKSFRFFWLALLLALIFTISFELLSSNYSFFIILMMPKTLMYIWFVLIGYLSFRKDLF